MKILLLMIVTALVGGCEVYTDSGHPEFVSGFNDQQRIKSALLKAESEYK
jgi:hypothetical protein